MSEGRSMMGMNKEGNQADLEGEGTASTETSDSEKMPTGSQPVVKKESLVRTYGHRRQKWFIL